MRNNYDDTVHIFEHINQGIRYYDQREYDLAIESYQKSIAINPEYASVYGWLGLTYSKQEKYDLAVRFFQKAISIDPEDGWYHYNLACVYSIQSKRQRCIESLWNAISIDKDYIGMAKKAGGSDFDSIRESPEFQAFAIESYQKAIAIDPEYAIYHYQLACVYSLQGKKSLSIESLRKAISTYVSQDKYYIKMAEKDSDFDNIRESPEFQALTIESYQKAISMDPEYPWHHYDLARVYSLQDKKSLSIESLRKAISLDKNCIGWAEENSDFDNICESPEFKAFTGLDA